MPVRKSNEFVYLLPLSSPQWENIVNVFFPFKRFSFPKVQYFCLNRWHKDVGKGDCHLCTHWGSMCLEIVFAVEFKRVLLKNKFKDSSEDWVGIEVFSLQKVWYALHTVFIPSSCGIFVHRLATSKETRKASSGRFLLSMKLTKSVVSLS